MCAEVGGEGWREEEGRESWWVGWALVVTFQKECVCLYEMKWCEKPGRANHDVCVRLI